MNTALPAPFAWDDGYLVGHSAMDDTHREFVECLNAVLQAPDDGLLAALDAFAAHAQAHFDEEDHWMRSTHFPPADCHLDEHAKVLASVSAVREALREDPEGNAAWCRELAQALQDWFPSHVQHLDSALATWLVHRTHGGRPLVLRRKSVCA